MASKKKWIVVVPFPKWIEGRWDDIDDNLNDILYFRSIPDQESTWEITLINAWRRKPYSIEGIEANPVCIDFLTPSDSCSDNFRHRFTIDYKRKELYHTYGDYDEFDKIKDIPSRSRKFSWLLGHWQLGSLILKISRPTSRNDFLIALTNPDGEKSKIRILKQSNFEIECMVFTNSTRQNMYARIIFAHLEKKVYLYYERHDFYVKEKYIHSYYISIINKSHYKIYSCFAYLENEKYAFSSSECELDDLPIMTDESVPLERKYLGKAIRILLKTNVGTIKILIDKAKEGKVILYNEKILIYNKKQELIIEDS